MRKKYISLTHLFCYLSIPLSTYSQHLVNIEKINQQPYIKYEIQDSVGERLTYYLSEFNQEKVLPLIVYIQGSGFSSLFGRQADGSIKPQFGHIYFAYEAQEKAKVLIIEKPGVEFSESGKINEDFDQKFSLESWANIIVETMEYVIQNERIDTSRIMVAGHSEGGVVAARVASKLKNLVSHVTIVAGEGPSQLYSLYVLAKEGVFFSKPGYNKEQRIDSLLTVWKDIQKDPEAITKKFWGFTYKRWSSFLTTSVYDELQHYNGAIRIVQGTQDNNVAPATAEILYISLLSKNKNVIYSEIDGADHSFNISQKPEINGWREMVKDTISWFLESDKQTSKFE